MAEERANMGQGVDVEDMLDDDSEKLLEELKEAVRVTKEELAPLHWKLSITLPRTFLDDRMVKQYDELRREVVIPGFRRGRAPLKLVQKRFAEDVGERMVMQMLSSGFMAAVDKEEIKTIGDPMVWAKVREDRTDESGRTRQVETDKLLPLDEAVEHLKIPEADDFTFVAEVETRPEFSLPELEGVSLTASNPPVSDADVDREIGYLRQTFGRHEQVGDQPLVADDRTRMNLRMIVDNDVIKEMEDVPVPVRDIRFYEIPIVGLGQALEGKKAGDEVTIEAPIPASHPDASLREKTARFEMRILSAERYVPADNDEELTKRLGEERFEDVRAEVRKRLESRREERIRDNLHEQMIQYLLEHTELALPPLTSQRLADQMISRRMAKLYTQNIPEAEIEKEIDTLKARARDDSVREIKEYFIFEKLAGDMKVDVNEEELNGAIHAIAASQGRRFDRVRDELSKHGGLNSLYMRLRDTKILDLLIAKASVTQAPAESTPEAQA